MAENGSGDRKRMLDETARKYLRGKREYDYKQAMYREEAAIAERITLTLGDFPLVQQRIADRTWNRLLNLDAEDAKQAREGMIAAIALFYEIHDMNNWDFEDTLHRALEEAYLYGSDQRDMPRREVRDVSFDADIRTPIEPLEVIERVEEKLARGEKVTDREFRIAVTFGGVQMENALLEHARERHGEERLKTVKEEIERNAKWFADEDVDAVSISETEESSDTNGEE